MTLHNSFRNKLQAREEGRALEEGVVIERQPAEPPCVLVIDDEPEITRSLASMLEPEYRIITAGSAEEGLAQLKAHSVAVILTDQRMPNGTGSELLARSLDISPETTRILLTGYSDISAVIDAVNEGEVYRYITKPWQPEELHLVISQGVERHQLVIENRRLLDELSQTNLELERRVAERTQQLQEQNRALEQARESIEQLSRTDSLTGLVNRRRLDEVLEGEFARSSRYGTPFTVVMADIDHFKDINDSFGHAVGDQVLKAVARAFEDAARMTDVVGRYGGEEFLCLLPNSGLEQARGLAERMRAAAKNISLPFRPEPLTASFGLAQWVPGDTADSLIDRADHGLYQAKATGRNRVAEYQPIEKSQRSAMTESTLDEVIRENSAAILVAAQTRMRDDNTMAEMAAQRDLTASDLVSQVLGFWLQAIGTDVTLGSTAAMEQGLAWLVRLREGHDLPFDDAMVANMFDVIATRIEAHLESPALNREFGAYREAVTALIAEEFPNVGEA